MAYPKLSDEPGAIETAAAIRSGKLSPLEAIEAAIGRIEALDGPINAVVVRDFERAREAARALQEAGPRDDQPLYGVPMTVKESFDVEGLPTTFGHVQFKDNIAARDSEVVARLKAAGAVILGKTNVPPDLADLQSNNPLYGRTNNPHDYSRVAGGSSGGSAAALASGMVAAEFGSDIGSSIRNPAHFCGVFGHKPSYGLVSKRGHAHPMAGGEDVYEGPMSVAGPLARSAEDLALLLRLTASFPLATRNKPISSSRLLVVLDHPVSEVDASVREPILAASETLGAAGAQVEYSSDLIPDLAAQHADYMRLLNIAMARGRPAPDGTEASLADYYQLLDAQARNHYGWAQLFETFDFVLAPPLPFVAYAHDDTPIIERKITINGATHDFADALAWAGLATFPDLPSTIVPIGASGGLPCGMQVMGPLWSDYDCIGAAGEVAQILHS